MLFLLSSLFYFFISSTVFAEEVQFEVAVDRELISLDESLTLTFKIYAEGARSAYRVGDPEYLAPEFQVVNSYESPSLQNFYINGQFSSRYSNEIVIVLRAKSVGSHTIQNISLQIDGKKYTAPDIKVEVMASGQGTPPPSSYGGMGGLRGAGKQLDNSPFLLRVEVSKSEVYKSEQLIVSYYLYAKSSISDFQTQKYPVLDQFFREDLAIPALNRRDLKWEPVTLDGITYNRALMAQYAAYPLVTGKLPIDSMSIKASYIVQRKGGGGNTIFDDPFFGNFFAQTQVATQSSQELSIQVNPLPEAGKPKNFKESVGRFEMTTAMDKNFAQVGEGVNIVVNIQGRGNVSAIEAPELSLPEGLSLFEVKPRSKMGRGGTGQKVFEYLIVPKNVGEFKIPPIIFPYFDPDEKKYKELKSDIFELKIVPSERGEVLAENTPNTEKHISENNKEIEILPRPLYQAGTFEPSQEIGIKKRVAYLGFVSVGVVFSSLFIFLILRTSELYQKRRLSKDQIPLRFLKLKAEFLRLQKKKNKKEFLSFLLRLQSFLIEVVEYYFECEELQAYPRSEWPRLLVETQKVTREDFVFLEKNFDFIEKLIFSGEQKPNNQLDVSSISDFIEHIDGFIEKCVLLKKMKKENSASHLT